jgi:hypothetical protein
MNSQVADAEVGIRQTGEEQQEHGHLLVGQGDGGHAGYGLIHNKTRGSSTRLPKCKDKSNDHYRTNDYFGRPSVGGEVQALGGEEHGGHQDDQGAALQDVGVVATHYTLNKRINDKCPHNMVEWAKYLCGRLDGDHAVQDEEHAGRAGEVREQDGQPKYGVTGSLREEQADGEHTERLRLIVTGKARYNLTNCTIVGGGEHEPRARAHHDDQEQGDGPLDGGGDEGTPQEGVCGGPLQGGEGGRLQQHDQGANRGGCVRDEQVGGAVGQGEHVCDSGAGPGPSSGRRHARAKRQTRGIQPGKVQ